MYFSGWLATTLVTTTMALMTTPSFALTEAERQKLMGVLPGYGAAQSNPTPTSTPTPETSPLQDQTTQSPPTPTPVDAQQEAQITQMKTKVEETIKQVEANQELPQEKKDLLLQNLKKMKNYSKQEWIKVLELIKSGKATGLGF